MKLNSNLNKIENNLGELMEVFKNKRAMENNLCVLSTAAEKFSRMKALVSEMSGEPSQHRKPVHMGGGGHGSTSTKRRKANNGT